MRSVGIAVLVCFAGVAFAAPTKQAVTKRTVTIAKSTKATKKKATESTKKRVAKKRWRRARGRAATPDEISSTAAYRYANMTGTECLRELDTRKISYAREATDGTRGVDVAVRLTGPLHGVEFRTNLAARKRASTPWEIADCRLVLALDDFAEILESHDVVDVRHYSMHRLVPKSWPEGKPTKQHMAGRAIDAARFMKRDGSYLDVDKHFHGAIGAATCGDKAAPRPATPEAVELRAILCEAVTRRLFNVVLTPNYNRAHKNHFHLEVAAGTWFLIH